MALITAAEARLYQPGLTGTAEDTDLDTLIARADEVLASWLGFPSASATAAPSLESTTYTHYSGPDLRVESGRELRLRVRPVQSITSIYVDPDWTYDVSADEVASGSRVLDAVAGIVYQTPTSTAPAFDATTRNTRAVYVAGFASGSVPEGVKQAVALLVKHWWDMRRTAGAASRTVDGRTEARRDELIPASVRQLVAPWGLWERSVA